MINITTAPPGNGKSLLVQGETIEEFVSGGRDIVTSTPVRIEPWLLGSVPQLGLAGVLRILYPDLALPERKVIRPGIVSYGHMLVVEDEKELGNLFLWRRARKTGRWFKLSWDERNMQFNPKQMAASRGCLVITDEAWKCYNSRNWKDTAKVVEFYGRQHRKFGDDWTLVSHSHKDLDTQLNRMCQAWRVCTNHGLRQFSMFRQPAVFRIRTYYEPPTSPNVPCFNDSTRNISKLVMQTYDTSAGVAVGGGRGADTKRKKKGLHWGWLLAIVLAITAALICVPFVLTKAVKSHYQNTLKNQPGVKNSIGVGSTNRPPRFFGNPPSSAATNQQPSPVSAPIELVVTGLAYNPTTRQLRYFFSNGTSILADDARVKGYARDGILVQGEIYRFADTFNPDPRHKGLTQPTFSPGANTVAVMPPSVAGNEAGTTDPGGGT